VAFAIAGKEETAGRSEQAAIAHVIHAILPLSPAGRGVQRPNGAISGFRPEGSYLSPDSTEETIAGLRKTGTIEVSGNYVGDAAQQSVDTLAQARTEFPWKITSPLSGARVLTVTGRGFINKRETGPFTPGGKTEFKFGVKVAGTLVYAIA
jgi:hypothetical protein